MQFNRTFLRLHCSFFAQMQWLSLRTMFSDSILHESRIISFWSTLSLHNTAHHHCAPQEEGAQMLHMPGL